MQTDTTPQQIAEGARIATPQQIADWLMSLPRVHDVLPLCIAIKGNVYAAAEYQQDCETPPGSDAYRRGERSYTRTMIYVVGMLPAVKRNGNVAFRMPGDDRDWFVAGYYGIVRGRRQEVTEPNDYHRFGNAFMLAPWDVSSGAAIDQYERHPYKRVEVRRFGYWRGSELPLRPMAHSFPAC